MPNTIWLVIIWTGEGQDYRERIQVAFLTEEKAIKHAGKINRDLKRAKLHTSSPGLGEDINLVVDDKNRKAWLKRKEQNPDWDWVDYTGAEAETHSVPFKAD